MTVEHDDMREAPAEGAAPADEELLGLVRAGDRVAFGALYDRHVRTVYRYATSLGAGSNDAEDVTQDVFVVAFEKARSIPLVGGSVLPWLLVTCKYVTFAKRRKTTRDRNRTVELDETLPDDETPEVQAERRAVGAAIDEALAQLSELDRRLFVMCTQLGYSYDDAARELGVSHATVRGRLAQMRKRLRAGLADHKEFTS